MAGVRRRGTFTLKVEGQSGIIANFHAANRRVQANVKRVVKRDGQMTRALAYFLAPKRTGFMAAAIELEFTDGGYQFVVFLDPQKFLGAGFAYYPVFVEFGTSRMRARPFMRATRDQMLPLHRANVIRAIREATS